MPSQEDLELVVLSFSSGSCEMMQQQVPRPFGQYSFTKMPSLLSLEMLPFQAGISSVCVSKSPLKV